MPSALWRIGTPFLLLLGLLSLQSLAPCVVGPDRAEASTQEERHEQPGKSKRSRTSKISIAPTTLTPATIRNLRTAVSPDSTRLVLDLDRKTPVRKHVPAQADGVVLEIPHATSSNSAHSKIVNGKLAKPFVIRQTSAESVAVSLPHGTFLTYTLLSLTNPPPPPTHVYPSTPPPPPPPPH